MRPKAGDQKFRINGLTFGSDVITTFDGVDNGFDNFTFTNTLEENEFWCGFKSYSATILRAFAPIACKWT